MEEYTPQEKKALELKRKANDKILESDGAIKLEDERLELTKEQVMDAAVEMELHEFYRQEGRTEVEKNEGFEITETRSFSTEEIINIIIGFENSKLGLTPDDFFVGGYVEDAQGNIIAAHINLRDDVSFQRFGYSVIYVYQLKGLSKKGGYVPITYIGKILRNADSDELIARQKVRLMYAENKYEREAIEGEGIDGMRSEEFLKFNGEEWQKAEKDDPDV